MKIYWDNNEITQGIGLNSAINTLGLWTDSSKAVWQIIDKNETGFRIQISFSELPVIETWSLEIESENEISWQVEVSPEEDIYVDEFRFVLLVSPYYKTWFSGYQEGDFPRISGWQDMPVSDTSSRKIGVRFPVDGLFLPSVLLDFEDSGELEVIPLIQNSPPEINARIIGAKIIGSKGNSWYSTGSEYQLFSAKICLFDSDRGLDKELEMMRQTHLRNLYKYSLHSKTKKKVLLVNLPWQIENKWGVRAGSRWPHIKDETEGNYLPFPFFLAYATSLLQENGIEAYLIDAIAEQIPEDKFVERIKDLDFDYLLAETSIPSFYNDLKILERVHEEGVSIILCGPNALIYEPQFLKEHRFIDFVLYGEYEFSLLELIKSLQENKDLSKIRGLIYRSDNEIIKNPGREPFDINLLPWPHRETLPMDKYWDLPGNIPYPSVQILASRGCPFGCNFCLWPQVMYQGNHYRVRDIEDVVDEMEYLVREKGFKSVYFDDDTFNIGKERMLRFCKEIKDRNLQNVPWAIMARPDLMDAEILENMKSAGLWAIKYGVETFSKELNESCYKRMDIERATKMIKLTKELGIKIHLTFCFGLEGETEETINRTIDYALKLDPESVQFSVLTPFPGTSLFEILEKEGRILIYDWAKYDGNYHCVFRPAYLTPEEIVKARNRAYLVWGEHLRRKRRLKGDIERFKKYLR
ncbi:MAG: radical SAM protein, partial [Candidatus Omnitrophota bacterium]